jgi:DNA primase
MSNKTSNIIKALKPLGEHATYYNQIKYDCPKCVKAGTGIGKKNLEVHSVSLLFHCWACNYKGYITKLIKEHGDAKYLYLFDNKNQKEDIIKKKSTQEFKLPQFLVKFSNPVASKEALNYLYSRGLTDKIIEERNIQYCYYGDLKDHIIFPSYDRENNLNAYVVHNFKKKKYKVFKNKNFTFFYESFIDFDFPIILTEGVYDSLSVPNAIPLLGTTISKSLAEQLQKRKIIIALDNDINQEVYQNNIKLLTLYGCVIKSFKIAFGKDINDYYLSNISFLKKELLKIYETI